MGRMVMNMRVMKRGNYPQLINVFEEVFKTILCNKATNIAA